MFNIGDKVRFIYTGMFAEIKKDHLDGSYTVWLEEDKEESIAFEDDIVLAKDFKKIETSIQQKEIQKKSKAISTEDLFFTKEELEARNLAALQPNFMKEKQLSNKSQNSKKTENNPQDTPVFSPPPIVPTKGTGTGCHLVFYPTSPSSYTIYLVNDTTDSFSFEYKLFLNQNLKQGFNKLIPPNTFFAIGEILQEQFNDSPSILFKCNRLHLEKEIKLKYKKMLGVQKQVPLMGLEAYSIVLFEQTNPYLQNKNSLKDYTEQHQKEQDHFLAPIQKLYRPHNLKDTAAFPIELDLHAESLVDDTSEFTPKELYELQLEVLDTYINKAAAIGIKEVFVIHGVGKGKLKQGVEEYLRYHGAVVSFKNEFHEKYGFGATRVVF